ncbi:MAG: ferritin-like domain-containing protein [Spirulina sp.]
MELQPTAIAHPIETRADLIFALKETAEIEHQFMCMYLYAAFSLKKNPDASCNAAQLEAVRRWASTLYKIARQEMEHLSLVNSLLAAIGGPPHFARDHIPTQSRYYCAPMQQKRYGTEECQQGHLESCDFPFLFEPFDRHSAQRYTCMESAKLRCLSHSQRSEVERWCFKDSAGICSCLPHYGGLNGFPLHRSPYWTHKVGSVETIEVGTIEEFYQRLREGFQTVADRDPSLFVGPDDRHQVEIANEYDIYIFPVTDLGSALNAIDLIVKQGEGINAPPYYDSHFQGFLDIALEYQRLQEQDPNFTAAYPVPSNPEESAIADPLAKKLFVLFNYSYVTLLYVLTGLYGWYRPASEETSYPHFSAALQDIAFAPVMTMLIRSLGEVIVQLPLSPEEPDRVAAPNFYISPEEDRQLQLGGKSWSSNADYTNISFYLERFEEIDRQFRDVLEGDRDLPPERQTQLEYIRQNVYRLTGNLREVYQTGVYSKFQTTP